MEPRIVNATTDISPLVAAVVAAAVAPYAEFLHRLVDEGRVTRQERDAVNAKALYRMNHLSEFVPAAAADAVTTVVAP